MAGMDQAGGLPTWEVGICLGLFVSGISAKLYDSNNPD